MTWGKWEDLDFLATTEYGVRKTAILSADRLYRYVLTRDWEPDKRDRLGTLKANARLMTFVMLNPSTADHTVDDPTIRRCMGFAKREGCDGITVVNLYAYRSSSPKVLRDVEDPVGPHNAMSLRGTLADPDQTLVAAWGAHKEAASITLPSVYAKGGWHCLGQTRSGAPRHPLYIKACAPLEPWSP